MRQSRLIHSASPGLVDLMFADLRHVRRLHMGFVNQLEELWDEETSRLEALRVEGAASSQLQLPVAPFVELLQVLLQGAAFMVAYTHWYATPLEERQRPLQRLVRKDGAVRALVDSLNRSSGGKDVQFFLRLPLRCLPRYSLLLDALAKELQKHPGDGSGITPDPTATTARQLQAHLERSQKSMAGMGDAIEVARASACKSVRLSILESADLATSSADGAVPIQHIIEARVVCIRNNDGESSAVRS